MKLYHTQLNSLEQLKKEKQRLRESLNNTPLAAGKPAQKGHTEEEGSGGILDIIQSVAEFLPMNVVSGMLMRLGLPVLKKAGKTAGKSAFSLGKEVFGGYVKWKLLELGYRWARRAINNSKQKKDK